MVYSYKMIRRISDGGILFKDGHMLNFSECNSAWRSIHQYDGNGIGERNAFADPPFFGFYEDKDTYVKIIITGFFKGKKFHSIKSEIENHGYCTYDLS